MGNSTGDVLLWRVQSDRRTLERIAHFQVTKNSEDPTCPWIFVSQPTNAGSRVYVYAISTVSIPHEKITPNIKLVQMYFLLLAVEEIRIDVYKLLVEVLFVQACSTCTCLLTKESY